MRLLPVVAGVLLMVTMFLGSCGNRREAMLQAQLDSLRTAEELQALRQQGLEIEAYANPLKMFYDSLNREALPVRYSPDYVELNATFSPVPQAIQTLLHLEGGNDVRAASLPQRGSLKPMLVAGYEDGDIMEIWLYSLDKDYFPLDKICLYDASDDDEEAYFAITSNYQIYRNHVLYHINIEGKILEDLVGNMPEVDDDGFEDEE